MAGDTKCEKEQPGIRRGELDLEESRPHPVSNKELLEASLEGSGETRLEGSKSSAPWEQTDIIYCY